MLASGHAVDARAERRNLRFDIAGQQRQVLLVVPETAAAAPRPLVIVFHGRGDDAKAFARAVELHRDWPDAIVAYPRGELHADSTMRGWQYRRGQYDDRDLKLVDRLLAELAARYGTRPETSYAAGFSNGGHFVLLLMAERTAAFAAYAVIGSVLPDYAPGTPPRPLLYLFGSREDRRYEDDWRRTVEALVRHNRSSGPLREVLACCTLQAAGPGGAPLVFGLYNAGHVWPSRGNEWLQAYFRDPWFGEPAVRSTTAPAEPAPAPGTPPGRR